MELLVITACRNASPWIERTLDSLASQTWYQFRSLVYADASTDGTAERVRRRIVADSRFQLRAGSMQVGASAARWALLAELHDVADSDLVLILDGDDWLAGPKSLETLHRFCTQHRLLACHGSFVHPDGSACSWSRDYPDEVKRAAGYRDFAWVATHPRVFRYGLFRALAAMPGVAASVCRFTAATDMALFVPILELAGEDTGQCPAATYVYNDHGGGVYSDRRIREQRVAEARIRQLSTLAPLPRVVRERFLDPQPIPPQ